MSFIAFQRERRKRGPHFFTQGPLRVFSLVQPTRAIFLTPALDIAAPSAMPSSSSGLLPLLGMIFSPVPYYCCLNHFSKSSSCTTISITLVCKSLIIVVLTHTLIGKAVVNSLDSRADSLPLSVPLLFFFPFL